MPQMFKWPSIEQYRNVIKTVQMKTRYRGKDENGEPVFDPYAPLPSLHFEGTVKLHGTNAAVVRGKDGEVWCQSRENIITPEKDNAGFAMYHHSIRDEFLDLLVTANSVGRCTGNVAVFGEWCGGNIQKGVALSELPKMFVIFGIADIDDEGNKRYFTKQQVLDSVNGCRELVLRPDGNVPTKSNVYCIYDFPTASIVVDFEHPEETQNTFNDITMKVEEKCPVGAAFGVDGIGEGVVWRCTDTGFEDSGFWFKVKGEKHSNSKVKTLATVDVERVNNLQALAEKVAHNGRLEQMFQQVFDTLNGGTCDIKRTGDFIKAVMTDIFKEETDTIAASGFTGKDLNGPVSKLARDFMMRQL